MVITECDKTDHFMKSNKNFKHISVILYVRQNGRLNPEFYHPVIKLRIQSSNTSVQAGFPKKNR